jgi:hypothetical protein
MISSSQKLLHLNSPTLLTHTFRKIAKHQFCQIQSFGYREHSINQPILRPGVKVNQFGY